MLIKAAADQHTKTTLVITEIKEIYIIEQNIEDKVTTVKIDEVNDTK